jgi:hypothetical protein
MQNCWSFKPKPPNEGFTMRYKIKIAVALWMTTLSLPAALLDIVEVSAPSIYCTFSPTCQLTASNSLSPLVLSNTVGFGWLQTLTYAGLPGTPGAGLYGYEYQIDLTGSTNDPSLPSCFTNAVSCFTNRVPITNLVVACRTNTVGGSNVVVCTTNRVRGFTNLVSCYTNRIPCPGVFPCVDSLRIPFGPVATNVTFATGGVSAAQAYIITSGGSGTVEPVLVRTEGADVIVEFARPVCPGEASVIIGLVSTNPPTILEADVGLNNGSNLVAGAFGPSVGGQAIACDFTGLAQAIDT